ncbi:anthranilate phosphoribosyltransferase [Suttonella sp. R2A3]|uniref:anthranilate phosphoribosyltransferase n=1 Tax=Suttonella sp. R2A3 TaxID=2908648 RepID=UPI001F30712C|nr:anthranilate phosphoribosyltransferase [Suttonella sp. R2A3]UJF24387.1 anthranilate phosphoribosyltransferase [Suttonella sp. R2A3]
MKDALALLVERKDVPPEMMQAAVSQMMTGEADPAAVGAFLIALTAKGETVAEVSAAAKVMRELAKTIDIDGSEILVDPVGTGGDGANLFNVSTASAIIAAAGGVKIAKHGNIAASSASGSADVLREAGVVLDIAPEDVAACVRETGFGFMFAQAYHQAMRHVVPVRRALGVRTVFNVLGPLSNPAGVKHQVLGVFSKAWLRPMAEVSRALGAKRVLVVHSHNGLDEFSVTHRNDVAELCADGSIKEYEVSPLALNMAHDHHREIEVGSAQESLALINAIFAGGGPKVGRDMLALNAAAIFYVAGKVVDLAEGVALAYSVLDQGLAAQKLAEIVSFTAHKGV